MLDRVPQAATSERAAPARRASSGAKRPLQKRARPTVGRADGQAEREADALVVEVVEALRASRQPNGRRPAPEQGRIRRTTAPSALEDSPAGGRPAPEQGRIRRTTAPSALDDPWAGGDLDDGTAERIQRAMGGGHPLPAPVRQPMEAAFGASLDHVRIHEGPEAGALNAAVSARAFTVGRDIFFGPGEFRPQHDAGQHLLAHELAHTMQQTPAAPAPSAEPVVRRRMAFTVADLRGSDKFTSALRAGVGSLTTWNEIRSLLREYGKATSPGDELRILLRLEVLGREFLTKHPDRTTENDRLRAESIEQMIARCEAELATSGAEQDVLYGERMRDTSAAIASDAKGKVTDQRFRYVTAKGAEGLDVSKYGELRAQPALAGVTLTDAEIAAIRVYTGGDYRLMNPLLEGSETWLAENVEGLTSGKSGEGKFGVGRTQAKLEKSGGVAKRNRRRDLKVEAGQHARLAVSGLKKLPNVAGTGYRGLTIPKAELDSKYRVGNTIVYKPFSSTSTRRDMARGYAAVPKEGKVGVLLELDIKQGRDVAPLSLAKGEDEILLLPGASFTVAEAPRQEGSVWVVTLRQTGPGVPTADTLAPAVPATGPAIEEGTASGAIADRTDALLDATTDESSTEESDDDVTVTDATTPVVATNTLAASGVAESLADLTASTSGTHALTASTSALTTDPAPDAAPPAPTLEELADVAARELIAAAAAAEPAVTALLGTLAANHGCRLEGLDHRLKTLASLSRKLADKVRRRTNPGDPAADTALEASKMNDVLRYTMIVPVGTYGQVDAKLREEIVKLTHEVKGYWNAWSDPNAKAYKGVNMTFGTSAGQLFELQLHTEASFATKQAIHAEYEEWRAAETTAERRAELILVMAAQWTNVQVPTGAVPTPKGQPTTGPAKAGAATKPAKPPAQPKPEKKTYPRLKVLLAQAAQGLATRAELEEGRAWIKREELRLTSDQAAPDKADRLKALKVLGDDIGFAIDRMRVDESVKQGKAIYLESGTTKGAEGGFAAITDPGRGFFTSGKPAAKTEGARHGLDDAEIAALGTYTADDYKYINPATAFSKTWLRDNMTKANQTGTERQRLEEGGTHAAVMSMAIAKLPVWKGATFRGERMSQKEFDAKFLTRPDGTVRARSTTDKRLAFTSMSRLREKGMAFATGGAGTPAGDQTIHVLYLIKVRDARDIQAFSRLDEAEVLCPPGATFKVTKVVTLKTGPNGNPKATAWYEVHITQQ